ncbi:MAG: hypothetical protein RLZZ360_779 [Candidatus Parcubacteria bacterium]|jgi:hypothetical protein
MGAWGTRIDDDDFALDVITEYFELYDNGVNPKSIRRQLEENNVSEIADPDEGYLFWFALAKAQWDVGSLDDDVFKKVVQIVESDIDTRRWISLEGFRPEKRKQSVKEFVEKIRTPREKPRKRKIKRLRSAPFETGDVLVFETSDKEYGACVILSAEKDTDYGTLQLVFTNIKQKKKPTIQNVIDSNILIFLAKHEFYTKHIVEAFNISVFFPRKDKDNWLKFEIIGRVQIKKVREKITVHSSWSYLIEPFEYRIQRQSTQKISLKKFIGYSIVQKIKVLSIVNNPLA